GEEATFFPSDHRCPDRQYLERSEFQPGGLADSAPRPVPAPATGMPPDETDGSARQEIPLAARALPAVPLHAALTGRVSARGPVLLSVATGRRPGGHRYRRRPRPAGALCRPGPAPPALRAARPAARTAGGGPSRPDTAADRVCAGPVRHADRRLPRRPGP